MKITNTTIVLLCIIVFVIAFLTAGYVGWMIQEVGSESNVITKEYERLYQWPEGEKPGLIENKCPKGEVCKG